jgi:hypothetical protein
MASKITENHPPTERSVPCALSLSAIHKNGKTWQKRGKFWECILPNIAG